MSCALLLQQTGEGDSIVVSYPGYIEVGKFVLDYTEGFSRGEVQGDPKDLYYRLVAQTSNFETKIVSLGPSTKPDSTINSPLMLHQCPTVRGTSGGLYLQLSQLLDEPVDDIDASELAGVSLFPSEEVSGTSHAGGAPKDPIIYRKAPKPPFSQAYMLVATKRCITTSCSNIVSCICSSICL